MLSCPCYQTVGDFTAQYARENAKPTSALRCSTSPLKQSVNRRSESSRSRAWRVLCASKGDSAAQKTAERRNLFNNIAPQYDLINDWLSLGQHRIWKRMTVKWSKASTGDKVLDICCGSGNIALQLAQAVGTSGEVVGLDFASQQLEIAKERQTKDAVAAQVKMTWIEGDALQMPFEDSSFDAITCGYGLRNVADIKQCFKEVLRVLKPGKSAAFLDFNNSQDFFVSTFQGAMLDNVVVPVASMFGMKQEYEYVRPSIERFPTGPRLEIMARRAGFETSTHYEIAGGLMGVLVVCK